MRITNITIENLGPYIGTNCMDFSANNNLRKVILIGGKNGAGKTTLFNSIRVGLYGCRAYGFESENAKYLEIISQMINKSAQLKKAGRASITISILMDDGKYDYRYQFERSWRLSTKNMREEVIVSRNGAILNETEKSDFQSYLLQLIPPDMFRFYFFDGESISNFVFNGVKNTDFKNAFLKLCGLDTMEIICDNLQRISNMRKNDASNTYEKYQDSLTAQNALNDYYSHTQNQKELISTELMQIEEALAKSEQDFIQHGGISKKEYQSMQTQINKEEGKREAARKWLKDMANDVLPFIILRHQLSALQDRISQEEQYQSAMSFREGLHSPITRQQLMATFKSVGIEYSDDLTEKVISVLSDTVYIEDVDLILNLSKRERLDMIAKINNLLAFDIGRVYSATKSIDASLQRVKQIRKKIDRSDSSFAEEYFSHKEELLQKKSQLLQEMLEVERKIDTLKLEQIDIDVQVKHTQRKYEEYLKGKSVSDITAKALLAFKDLQHRLYEKFIADVENTFSEHFHALINKFDLIDGIKIDEQLQVHPFKNKTFQRVELDILLKKYGENNFVNQLGSIAYEAYMKADSTAHTDTITLPVEVKQQLSAGEKQIFIMALYQSLSKLNKVSVPYIIDSPFARIDTEHRNKILNNFFLNLRGQIIILSTDEEIVGAYRDSIDASVSNYYLLQHSDNGGTRIISNSYFGGDSIDI